MKKKARHIFILVGAWLLLIAATKWAYPYVETLPLPLALFWIGTGAFLAPFFLHRCLAHKGSVWKIEWKQLGATVCGLLSLYLYFFHSAFSQSRHFFLWAPPLYLIASIVFCRGRKGKLRLSLLLLALLIPFFLSSEGWVSAVGTLFFVAFALQISKAKEIPLSALFPPTFLQVIGGGLLSYLHWGEEGSLSLLPIGVAVGTGWALGSAILLWMRAFHTLFKKKKAQYQEVPQGHRLA